MLNWCRWLQAKEVLLSSEDYGNDMTSANTLLNNHLDISRELDTITDKVKTLEEEAELLGDAHPNRAQEVI